MLIVFTGHRDAVTDPVILHALEAEYPGSIWMHGGAEGFDTQAHNVGKLLGKTVLPPITSEKLRLFALPTADAIVTVRPAYAMYHDAQKRMAPIIRNEAMVSRMSAGDLLVACWDGREKGGTWQCVSYARRHGKTIRVVEVRKL